VISGLPLSLTIFMPDTYNLAVDILSAEVARGHVAISCEQRGGTKAPASSEHGAHRDEFS
jgi:hypothetical protein